MSPRTNPMRIACYALIAKDAGSLASANYLIIEELLKRGYEIDFYAVKGFNVADEFYVYKNFNYISFTSDFVAKIWSFLDKLPNQGGILYKIWANISINIHFQNIANAAIRNHKSIKKYDFVFVLGLPSFFKIKGIPTISWLQGTFHTEWDEIKSLKEKIISLCGKTEYLKLALFYQYKNLTSKRIAKNSDIFICGSQWSQEMLCEWGLEKEKTKVLPYPIDINFFQPNDLLKKEEEDSIKLLWLGRIVPRKRLDLLLDAVAMLIKENQNIHLQVIGDFPYGKGYKKLIDNFPFPDNISYQQGIERLSVPNLINSVDVLVQPSQGENFGSSVAEALCCGVPVILGKTNGTKDFVGSSSFIFEEYSPESLKRTMEKAIESLIKNREQITSEARLTAEQEFDVLKVVDKLETIFVEATQNNN